MGNFDGIHLGHQRILGYLVDHARRRSLVSLLLTFAPHPEAVLGRGRVLMIQTLERRLELVRASGVDEVLVMPFDAGFSSLTPSGFLNRVLVEALKARAVFVGKNFHFGRGRTGTVKTLERFSLSTGLFEVCVVPPVMKSGRVVSSSLIRKLLFAGEVSRAGALLGRPYELRGRVVSGQSVGRRLGFPTANIRPENEILPPGIFISRAVIGSKTFPGLTYIGRRPTFASKDAGLHVETYLLVYRGRLYGKDMTVFFLNKLRSDRKFSGAAALAAAIQRDVSRAQKYFKR